MTDGTTVHDNSGNVFADLGTKNADEVTIEEAVT